MARRRNNEDILMAYQVGDLIKFPREGYSHYGVYVGGGKVVHFTCQEGNIWKCCNLLSGKKKGKVKEESFWNVVRDMQASIDNYMDWLINPYPPEEIVRRAKSHKCVGPGEEYECGACETFATCCRYGYSISKQIIKVSGGIAAVVTFLCLVMRRHGS